MTYDGVSGAIKELERELKDIRVQVASLDDRRKLLENTIAALNRVRHESGSAASGPPPGKSKRGGRGTLGIREEILDVLVVAGGTMTDREILAGLDLRDKAPASDDQLSALRSTLGRMVKDGVLVRLQPGVYRLAEPPSTNGTTSAASEGLALSDLPRSSQEPWTPHS